MCWLVSFSICVWLDHQHSPTFFLWTGTGDVRNVHISHCHPVERRLVLCFFFFFVKLRWMFWTGLDLIMVDMLSWVDFQQMRIRKLMPLPHHIATIQCCVCICAVISGWYALLCLFFPSCHGTCILSRCTQRWCRTVSLCLSAFIPYPTMHYDSPPMACPVLFCSAPNLFSLSLTVSPLSLPFSLRCSILLIFSSLAGQGATEAEERGEEEGRNVKFCLALTLLDYLFLPPLFFFAFVASSVQHCGGLR